MPAPRYVNELQENAVWICLSCLWAAGAMLAWLSTTANPAAADVALWNSPQAWASALTLVALAIAIVSFVLRLPILSSPPHTSLASDHVVWLLTACATVNWIGWLAFQAPTWSDLIPALLVIGVAEVWFHGLVFERNALPWLRQYCAVADVPQAVGESSSLDSVVVDAGQTSHESMAVAPSQAADGQILGKSAASRESSRDAACAGEHAVAESPVTDSQTSDGVDRRAVSGVDEQGKRYVSGEVKICLAAGQSVETLAIAFSPPFAGEPDADFECEGAEQDVTVQLVHKTPGGMRLGVRRGASTEPVVFWLQWYAVELELNEAGEVLPNSSRALP